VSLSEQITSDLSGVFFTTSDFAETIVLQLDGDIRLTAIVDVPPITDAAFGSTDVTGLLSLKTADLAAYSLVSYPVLTAIIRGQNWHLHSQVNDGFGVTTFALRSKFEGVKHSNIYDLDGNQASWSDLQ